MPLESEIDFACWTGDEIGAAVGVHKDTVGEIVSRVTAELPPSDKLAAEHGDEEERLARERQLAALKRGDAAPDPKTFRDGDLGESRAKAAKAQAQPRGEDGTFGTGCDSEESPTVHLPHAVAARVLAEDPLDFPGRGA